MFVRRVVVEDDVHVEVRRNAALRLVAKGEELLMAMLRSAIAEDRAGGTSSAANSVVA
jgi:hypothetical protein